MLSPRNRLLLQLILAAIILACVAPVQARKVRLKGNPPVERVQRPGTEEVVDTLRLPGMVRMRGYEKTRDASRESVFVTNGADSPIVSLTLKIDYLDMAGRQLHSRTVKVPVYVPAGETRLVEFKSWDSQHVFYYKGSPAPLRAQASPYDVRMRVQALTLRHR